MEKCKVILIKKYKQWNKKIKDTFGLELHGVAPIKQFSFIEGICIAVSVVFITYILEFIVELIQFFSPNTLPSIGILFIKIFILSFLVLILALAYRYQIVKKLTVKLKQKKKKRGLKPLKVFKK